MSDIKQIKENNFEPGVGGSSGTSNYQAGYGTHASPDVTQNPAHFQTGKSMDNHSNTSKGDPNKNSQEKDLNSIYSKKDTPTPDEIVAGIKYEMGQQIKKDKGEAKRIVIDNCKKDPHYYSKLKMLNIDDESMVNNMTENKHPNDNPSKVKVINKEEETKKIFAEMAKGRDNKYVVNFGICDVMKQMWEAKKQRNSWKTGN